MARSARQQPQCPPLARPFLKWVGGKGQLLAQFAQHYPKELKDGTIRRYVEPFVGGGAVFLDIAQSYTIGEALLIDINPELILAYQVVKEAPDGLVAALREHRDVYLPLDAEERKKYYYGIRDAYNTQRKEIDFGRFSELWVARAAYMLFLNRTCFNGLFRVNAEGGFNVPLGRYANPSILDESNILRVSQLLQKATLRVGRFQDCRAFVDDATFVYFDPPYRPISATSSFTSYSKSGFSDTDQAQLARFYAELDAETGAKLMLSNSDPTDLDPDDDFFEQLYRRFHIHKVRATRMVNSKADGRGQITELLITNY